MKYPTIRIEGAILTSDILDKIGDTDIFGQKPKDFGFTDAGSIVKDEIVRVWADAQDYWRIFQRQQQALKEHQTGTTETRNQWIVPLLGFFGYRLEFHQKGEMLGDKNYQISHRDTSRGDFPVHIISFRDSLDRKRPDSQMKMSPHGMIQEYLNLTEHLYAIVTNGYTLRLLRDSTRLIKLSYIEFDLDQMFRDNHFNDFAIMFRLIHASRMPVDSDAAPESIIERYHTDSLVSGSRIRDGLRRAVEKTIESFANGFLQPGNKEINEAICESSLSAATLYQQLLRLIYRILFLMVIEERNIVYPEGSNSAIRDIYYRYYSISRIRKLAGKPWLADPRHSDCWESMKNTFLLFEDEKFGHPLGIKPLAGDLFRYDAIGDLNKTKLDNKCVLECLTYLSFFKNPVTNGMIRVNYAALNVEEFGSVYEGLLDYDPQIRQVNGRYQFSLVKGNDRGASGTHYTPDELVQPLIKHSLDYVIQEKLSEGKRTANGEEKSLLSIKVCDPACGSGHILLNAARRIATELACVRTGDDQPSPTAFRAAVRDVIRHCIYGVDINPMAVELCKVALWLEAHNPNEPLNFLDHHIKCGDAIVGVAHADELDLGIPTEAFQTLSGDDKQIAAYYRKRNEEERVKRGESMLPFEDVTAHSLKTIRAKFMAIDDMPETTPAEIDIKKSEYERFMNSMEWWELAQAASIRTAQFFIPKTKEHDPHLMTDELYRSYVQGEGRQSQASAFATGLAVKRRFFHWFLEFPEVFSGGGFDCIVGNPPFLGGQKISGTYGSSYLEYLKFTYAPARSADLVTYFFRRAFDLIRNNGFQSLISTNTIAQGGAREGGLTVILETGGAINHAVRSTPWPGAAAVEVSLVTVYKGDWPGPFVLNRKPVERITSYLDDAESLGDPFPLIQNENKSFQGSIVLGAGFVLRPDEAEALIRKDPRNQDVLFPYLNGDDLNSRPDQSPSRWVINFHDWPLNEAWDRQQKQPKGPPYAADYPDCLEIVERLVKPEREKVSREIRKKHWWRFAEQAKQLYRNIAPLDRVLVINRHSKFVALEFSSNSIVFSEATVIFALNTYAHYSILSSVFHDIWAWKYCSTMGSGTVRYAPSNCFETIPFPPDDDLANQGILSRTGQNDSEFRQQIKRNTQLGLTKLYNQFHNAGLVAAGAERLVEMTPSEIEKRFGKETLNLWKYLQKTPGVCGFSKAVTDILELRDLHVQMDEAVKAAYGWTDIELRHDFYELEYLPENDRVRYTICPEARREILKRLLLLNHKIYEEEQRTVVHSGKGKQSRKQSEPDINQSPEMEMGHDVC